MRKQAPRVRLLVEALELRIALATDVIRLEVVALHEFGHAIGLHHHANPLSIMHDSYNANYDVSLLANDPAVVADETDLYLSLRELYSASLVASNGSPWFDALDPAPGNGVVDITWSIMPDGTQINNDVNIINRAFDEQFGAGWRGILASALNLWAGVSEGRISFVEWGDSGKPFNYGGRAQNDLDSGDIRIGAYMMDGPGGKLAESYFPSPIGTTTAPGDVFFDAWEPFAPGSGGTAGGNDGGSSGGSSGPTTPPPGGSDGGSSGPITTPPGGGDTPAYSPTPGGDGALTALTSAALVSDSDLGTTPVTFVQPSEQPTPTPSKPLTPTTRGRNRSAGLYGVSKLGGKAAGKLSIVGVAKHSRGLPSKTL